MSLWGRAARRCAVVSSVFAAVLYMSAGDASAQNPNDDSATALEGEAYLACIYEQLPTRVKLRFELAARVDALKAAEIIGGPLGGGFVELVERCGFTADDAMMARAQAYWLARAARQVAAIEADRAGLNIETLEIALLAAGGGVNDDLAPLAEEMLQLGGPSAEGAAGARVLETLDIYENATEPLSEEARRLAATFIAAEIVVAGLEAGAELPDESAQ